MFGNMAQLKNHVYKDKLEELRKNLGTLTEGADYTSTEVLKISNDALSAE